MGLRWRRRGSNVNNGTTTTVSCCTWKNGTVLLDCRSGTRSLSQSHLTPFHAIGTGISLHGRSRTLTHFSRLPKNVHPTVTSRIRHDASLCPTRTCSPHEWQESSLFQLCYICPVTVTLSTVGEPSLFFHQE